MKGCGFGVHGPWSLVFVDYHILLCCCPDFGRLMIQAYKRYTDPT